MNAIISKKQSPSRLSSLYNANLSLLTDLYQLTMAYGYWKNGLYDKTAVFNLFYRKNPFNGNYAIASGLDQVIDYLKDLHFDHHDIQYLASLKGADNKALFDESFLNYLQRMEFSCDIDAVAEGTIVFPHEPLIRVKGPLLQAQLIETALLTITNFSTLIATKASRIVSAAQGDEVLEFGLRRAQGIDGGISASRAAYIGGCHATSNLLAGKLYNIPVKGTHAHSWVMCFDDELEAFQRYASTLPNNCVFLVDTYDTIEGVKKAIETGKWLRAHGHEMLGIRLDSGDLISLSIKARKLLDAAGFEKAKIVASNNLDEAEITRLKDNGAQIAVWGVGTKLATAYDQPALGGVYKLAAIKDENDQWNYKVKLSEENIKTSNPGMLQVRRLYQAGQPVGDAIFDSSSNIKLNGNIVINDFQQKKATKPQYKITEDLLLPIFRNGELVYKKESVHKMRERSLSQVKMFKSTNFKEYLVGLEDNLFQKKATIIKKLRN